MIAECPKCKARFKLDESKMPPSGVKLRCSKCRTVFAVKERAKAEAKASSTAKAYKVLIANSDPTVCATVEELLGKENIEVLKADNGVDALTAVEQHRPHVAILDVALPMMYGFEVCEHIKGHGELKDTKVILMASIYDKTRYKRNPMSLYGAEDYIEKHHIHDSLLPKINNLILSAKQEEAKSKPSKEIEQAVTTVVNQEIPTEKELERLKTTEKAIDDKDREAQEKARRLARLVVSDIALYNADLISEGIKNGTFYTILKDDIKEGLEHFKKKTPPSISADAYLKDAFEEFISKRKQEMGL